MIMIKPPHPIEVSTASIFLAGSIAQDKAQKWQDYLTDQLSNTSFTILNPRRESWDSSWQQIKAFEPFREQVEWELEGLEVADLIIMYFDPSTQSPISLLELGLYAQSKKLVVCCPEGFWRKGNVDIVCERYGVPQVEQLDDFIPYIDAFLGK
ncbi:MAG: nucleoside 2-deoxyribosyltransferase domain-containing protein [Saprospiraceae bacterium]